MGLLVFVFWGGDRDLNPHILADSGLEVRWNWRFGGLKYFAGTSRDLERPLGLRGSSAEFIPSQPRPFQEN